MNINFEKIKNIIMFNRVSALDRLLFTKYLAEMLKSGIPLDEAIETSREQSKNKHFKKILQKIEESVDNGQTLAKALSKFPEAFDAFYISLIKVGEDSGNLEDNLNYLSVQIKKTYEFNKKIQGALLYPGLILFSTLAAGGGLALFVLPQLVDLFKSLNTELPLSTKILLFVAQTSRDYGILIAAGLLGIIIVTPLILASPLIKPKWHKVLLLLPGIGVLVQNIQLTNLCRNIGIMLKSGITILPALKTQYQAADNLVIKDYLGGIIKGAEAGRKLSDEINTHKFKFFPAIFAKMIGIGEETGKLDESFIYLGDFFEEEVDEMTKNLSTILEPALLLIIGLVVGFVAMAIISPIYELTGSIKK